MTISSSHQSRRIINIAAYKFVPLDDLAPLRDTLLHQGNAHQLKGTILLSPEGINLFLAGTRCGIDTFLKQLRGDARFADLAVKESISDYQPFRDYRVRLKKEIITLRVPGIDPGTRTSPRLSAWELKRWLDEGKPVTLLDARNRFEVEIGTFKNAVDLKLGHFTDFPDAVKTLPEELKQQPIVTFCTGGIRCEKAGPVLENQGFQQVWQLDGGILKYFEECGGEHFDGECFVFDHRVSLDSQLQESAYKECFCCRAILNQEDQQSEYYMISKSCPLCYKKTASRND